MNAQRAKGANAGGTGATPIVMRQYDPLRDEKKAICTRATSRNARRR